MLKTLVSEREGDKGDTDHGVSEYLGSERTRPQETRWGPNDEREGASSGLFHQEADLRIVIVGIDQGKMGSDFENRWP